jgi:hypothetical protein
MTMNKAFGFSAVRLHFTLSALAVLAVALVCGCSDSDKLAGTAVEPNEMAENDPNEVKDPESSSSVIDVESSSSSAEVLENVSSSSNKGDNNTLRPGDIGVSSSSITPVEPVSSSSARSDNDSRPGGEQSGTKPGADLSGYGAYYGVSDASFDSVVVASTVVYGGKVEAEIPIQNPDDSSDTHTPGTSAAVTELNSPGLHKMGDRLKALYDVFPASAKALIALGEKAAAEDPSCETYLYNVRGQSGSIGHMLVGVASDTLTVLDIRDDKCQSTEGLVVGFVFIYCGEMDRMPFENRIYADRDPGAGKCPVIDTDYEWTE